MYTYVDVTTYKKFYTPYYQELIMEKRIFNFPIGYQKQSLKVFPWPVSFVNIRKLLRRNVIAKYVTHL